MVRLNFSFSYLSLQIDGIELKEAYDPAEYPNNSISIEDMVLGNLYAEYPLYLSPNYQHNLTIGGNGLADVIIISDYDYDGDLISTGDEIQEGFNPIIPESWGWFDNGYSKGANYEGVLCLINLFIAQESDILFYLYDGEIADLTIDGEDFEGEIFTTDYTDIGILSPGFHQLIYNANGEEFNIDFFQVLANSSTIQPLNIRIIEDVLDMDGDYLKDLYEYGAGLDPFNPDYDNDGLLDGFDPCPHSSLEFAHNEIMQIVFPAEKEKTTMITLLIKKPQNDYSRPFQYWRDGLNISIIPALRIFGNSTTSRADLCSFYGKGFKNYSLVDGYNLAGNGDFIPASDPDAFYTIEPLISSDVSWLKTFIYEPFHQAKNDFTIDLRFDVIWLVLESDFATKEIRLAQIYNMEEPIIIQALQHQEIGPVDFQIIRTDSNLEARLFETLFFNPELGAPSDFIPDIDQKILITGNEEYLDVAGAIYSTFEANPPASSPQNNETELERPFDVIYMKGVVEEKNILDTINGIVTSFRHIDDGLKQWSTIIDTKLKGVESILYDLRTIHIETAISPDTGLRLRTLEPFSDIEYAEFEFEGVLTRVFRRKQHHYLEVLDINDVYQRQQHTLSSHTFIEVYEIDDVLQVPTKLRNYYEGTSVESAATTEIANYLDGQVAGLNKLKSVLKTDSIELITACQSLEHVMPTLYNDLNTLKQSPITKKLVNDKFNDINDLRKPQVSMSDIETFRDYLRKLNELKQDFKDIIEEHPYMDTKFKSAIKRVQNKVEDMNIKFSQIEITRQHILDNFAQFEELETYSLLPAQKTLKKVGQKITDFFEKHHIFSRWLDRVSNALQLIGGTLSIYTGIVEIMSEIARYEQSQNPEFADDEVLYHYLKLISASLEILLGSLEIFEAALSFASEITTTISKSLVDSIGKYCAVITGILSMTITILEVFNYFNLQPDFTLDLLLWQIGKIAIEAVFVAISIIAAFSPSGPGIVVGIVIGVLTLIFTFLTFLFIHPDMKVTDTKFIMPQGFYQHGGFRVGDLVGLEITYKNTGDSGLFDSEVRLAAKVAFGPQGDYQFDYDYLVYGPKKLEGKSGSITVWDVINKPTRNLWYKLLVQAEIWYWEFIVVIPLPTGYIKTDDVSEGPLTETQQISVMDASAALCAAGCTPFNEISLEGRIAEITSLMENYRWYDAYNELVVLVSILSINLVIAFYIALSTGDWTRWTEIMLERNEALALLSSLPIRTNIEILDKYELDPNQQITRNLHPVTVGIDDPQVKYEITPPDGWAVSYSQGFQPLSEDIGIIITPPADPYLEYGTRYFDIKIYTNSDDLIYEGEFEVTVKRVHNIIFEIDPVSPIITPGVPFEGIITTNLGNAPEYLEYELYINIDGDPNNWTTWERNIDWISVGTPIRIDPGESAAHIIINIPRHYSITPGEYKFMILALDYFALQRDPPEEKIYGYISDVFIIDEFYDISLKCDTPNITIYDNDIMVYNFTIRNLGNIEDFFQITHQPINIAIPFLDQDNFDLAPGASDSFSLTLIPSGWGTQTFEVNAITCYNSTSLDLIATIIDDDPNPPLLTNLQINDAILNMTLNFDVLNEIDGDDQGLYEIKIFIDDQMLVDYQPTPNETSFSFTLYDGWLMEYGIHEIRIELTDNDDDVVNDSLTSIYYGEFERTPDEMLSYILWEINELKEYIDQEITFIFNWMLIILLEKTERRILDALDSYLSGREMRAVILGKLAKANLDLLIIIDTILTEFGLISGEDGDYISMESHKIQEHITLTICAIVGTEAASLFSAIPLPFHCPKTLG